VKGKQGRDGMRRGGEKGKWKKSGQKNNKLLAKSNGTKQGTESKGNTKRSRPC
jgi:hypothetical protein